MKGEGNHGKAHGVYNLEKSPAYADGGYGDQMYLLSLDEGSENTGSTPGGLADFPSLKESMDVNHVATSKAATKEATRKQYDTDDEWKV